MTSPQQQPAPRFITAQSWWIASELVRRHPELRLIETNPGAGGSGCLSLCSGERDTVMIIIDLNRNVHAGVSVRTPSDFQQRSWAYTLASDDPHAVVKQLEAAAGLSHPSRTPSTSPAALAYRIIARVLASLVNDKETWDVRNEQEDSSDGGWGPRNLVKDFPRAAEIAQVARPDDIGGTPGYRFWALLKSDHPVAIFDTDGHAYLSGEQHDLPTTYKQSGRSLSRTINMSIGKILP